MSINSEAIYDFFSVYLSRNCGYIGNIWLLIPSILYIILKLFTYFIHYFLDINPLLFFSLHFSIFFIFPYITIVQFILYFIPVPEEWYKVQKTALYKSSINYSQKTRPPKPGPQPFSRKFFTILIRIRIRGRKGPAPSGPVLHSVFTFLTCRSLTPSAPRTLPRKAPWYLRHTPLKRPSGRSSPPSCWR